MEEMIKSASDSFREERDDFIEDLITHDEPVKLFEFLGLEQGDIAILRYMAKTTEDFDLDDFVDYLKSTALVVEAMYFHLLSASKDYEPRKGQVVGTRLMAINHYFRKNMFGEYPTGSGKSFMYLIAASAIHAVRREKTTVVTAGINLQEQLASKDLPAISKIFRSAFASLPPFGYVVFKGRANYVCNKRLATARKALSSGGMVAKVRDMEALRRFVEAIPDVFDGDTAGVPAPLSYTFSGALVCSDASSCGCRSCRLKGECYYYEKKRMASVVSVQVINYHLLFTEVFHRGAPGALTERPSMYVFDEAHEMVPIARDFSEEAISRQAPTAIKASATSITEQMTDTLDDSSFANYVIWTDALEDIKSLYETEFAAGMARWYRPRRNREGEFFDDVIISREDAIDTSGLSTALRRLGFEIDAGISEALDRRGVGSIEALASVEEEDSPEVAILYSIQGLSDRAFGMASILDEFSAPEKRDANRVYWITQKDDSMIFKMKKVYVPEIRDHIFSQEDLSSVSVSATLSTAGTFNFFGEEVMAKREDVGFRVISSSPFDLRKQELWYLPEDALSASRKDSTDYEYQEKATEVILRLLERSQGGMLALFTSTRAMENTFKEVYTQWSGRMAVQGDDSKKVVLNEFRDDLNATLFATRSFFTGVDVKGPSLRVLVIDKLPFEHPSDPVTRTLSEKPGGFYKYSIPRMIMILKQIVGRGVRSRTDKCVICFLDKRLGFSSYAKNIRASFRAGGNYAKKTRDIDDVGEFLAGILKDYGIEKEEEEDYMDIPF